MYLIAIPLGVIAGRYHNSLLDKTIVLYSFISLCDSNICISINFPIYLWLSTNVVSDKWYSRCRHRIQEHGVITGVKSIILLLPAITYAILGTTGIIQYLRSEIIDAKTMDYVKTARSKGIPMKKVYSRHIFRNSLLPIAAFLGFTITGLLGGSIFIETVFGYPGMGKLFIESINGT